MEQGVLGPWHSGPAYLSFLTIPKTDAPQHLFLLLPPPSPPTFPGGGLPQALLAFLCDLPAAFIYGPMARLKLSPLGRASPAVLQLGAQQTERQS